MDIFAHAVWTNIIATIARRRQEKMHRRLLSVAWTTFWGVFPDLFTFSIPFIIGIVGWISGSGFQYGRETITSGLAPMLYNYSHSLVIWAVVFGITWAIYRRPRWELLGWTLHILIDIPSHANGFYLTPLFFPLSGWKFTHGISWAHPLFMVINYSIMLVAWIGIVWYRHVLRKKAKTAGTM
jgi:hypothetical protein